jgi:thymidylate synthase (FAD)
MNKVDLLEKWKDPIKCLDQGFVRLVDVMGDDEAIEMNARISYQKGTRQVSDTRALIRYMVRHRHNTPLESCFIKIGVKLPIFVERQWARHRTAHWNELSGRYSVLPEEYYIPEAEQICYQSGDNKQGRSGPFPPEEAEQLRDQMNGAAIEAFADYRQFCEAGMARETARMGLPVSTYTEKIWTIDLHNLFNFLSLRLDSHAQWEIRVYAQAIWEIVKDWVPLAAEAFTDYRLEAETFSKQEMQILRVLLRDYKEYIEAEGEGEGLPPAPYAEARIHEVVGTLPKRERIEFLKKFGLPE